MLKLFNTLGKKLEPFEPVNEETVNIFTCGPSVYQRAHIGNFRTYVLADVLQRVLKYLDYEVTLVSNITDVGHLTDDAHDEGEDKLERQAEREGKTAHAIAEFYTRAFFKDLETIGIAKEKIKFPRATDHIKEQIAFIKKIEAKGYAYRTNDGIYFDTAKIRDYGKLARLDRKGLKSGARVAVNLEKRHPSDFALWKFSPAGAHRMQEWESPWGVGFPGWHIECSAMGKKFLGDQFDIHTGGMDLAPVHHVNEIAQTTALTGKPPARYWLHSNFVTMGDEKMSKSIGNIITLDGLAESGISARAYRYLLLSTHYRKPLTFTPSTAESALHTLKRLDDLYLEFPPTGGRISDTYHKKFLAALADDINTPKALAVLWGMIRDKKLKPQDKRATLLAFDQVLGLGFKTLKPALIPPQIQTLVFGREKARQAKNWVEADAYRIEARSLGYEIEDTPEGPKVKKV